MRIPTDVARPLRHYMADIGQCGPAAVREVIEATGDLADDIVLGCVIGAITMVIVYLF